LIAGTSVPGIRSRFVDTAVELKAGQTLALAGLLQVRTESQSIGIPGLADLPYLGAIFRSNREVQNEVELLILVTPNFASPMDCNEVPVGGPGFNSASPLDKELYMKGYIEVPATCGPNGEACVQPNESLPQHYSQAYSPTGAPSQTAGTRFQTAGPDTKYSANAPAALRDGITRPNPVRR